MENIEENNMTFRELFDKWYEERSQTVTELTGKIYRSYLNKYIPDDLKNRPVNSIDYDEWKRIKVEMMGGKAPNGSEVAPSTARMALGVYHSVFIYGKREFGLKTPADGEKVNYRDICSITVFTKSEIQKMRKAVKPYDVVHLGIMLCLYTGVEVNEICAVSWGDLDLQNKIMKIHGVVERKNKRAKMDKTNLIVTELSDKKTNRELPIPTWIAEQLIVMKPMHDDDESFLTGEKGYAHPMTFRGQYSAFIKAVGVEKRPISALRHTFAMTCVEKNVEVGTLSEMLGHKRVGETIRMYYRVKLTDKREIVENLYE